MHPELLRYVFLGQPFALAKGLEQLSKLAGNVCWPSIDPPSVAKDARCEEKRNYPAHCPPASHATDGLAYNPERPVLVPPRSTRDETSILWNGGVACSHMRIYDDEQE